MGSGSVIELQRAVGNQQLLRAAGGQTGQLRSSVGLGNGGVGAPPVVQRQKLAGLGWTNAVIAAENQVQHRIREAMAQHRGRLELDLAIEPDFVGVARAGSSGAEPPGSRTPDGFEIWRAAHDALRLITLSGPPSARRVYSVVLERTVTGWRSPSFALTGEATPAEASPPREAAAVGGQLAGLLGSAESSGRDQLVIDFVAATEGVRISRWQSQEGAAGSRGRSTTTAAATDRAVRSFNDVVSLNRAANPRIYTMTFRRSGGAWTMQSMQLLGEIRPAAPAAPSRPGSAVPDEAETVIADVRGTRQLVLSTAAKLIAEQDPSRLDNLLFSVGPFAVGGILRLGKAGRLGRLARLLGRPARRVFGETRFQGLIQNRPLRDLTHHEIYQAFRNTPFTPTNHAITRLKDVRTKELGITTLNDVARHLNNGIIEESRGLISIQLGSFEIIVNAETRVIVTISPL